MNLSIHIIERQTLSVTYFGFLISSCSLFSLDDDAAVVAVVTVLVGGVCLFLGVVFDTAKEDQVLSTSYIHNTKSLKETYVTYCTQYKLSQKIQNYNQCLKLSYFQDFDNSEHTILCIFPIFIYTYLLYK